MRKAFHKLLASVLLPTILSAAAHAQTLGEALDATNLTWTTSGNALWFGQTNVAHDGIAAAQTGAITNNQFSVLQTTVTGPGTLTFWWQVPFQGQHRLIFAVDGLTQAEIYGSEWRQQTNYLGYGNHNMQWTFTNYYEFGTAGDAGRLDEVNFTAGTTAPIIVSQPASQTQAPGLDANFAAAAVGTPPLSYQWQFNGTNIPDAQSPSFTVTNTQAINAGSYSVAVSNIAGSTLSSNAVLSLVSVAAWAGVNDVPANLTNVIAVAVGDYHSLALQKDGTVVGWGYNAFGQAEAPVGLTNAIAIAAGEFHSLALKADGTIVAWGRNDSGQTNVPLDLTNVVAIAAGGDHCLALNADGIVAAWGSTNHGKSSVPFGLSNVVAISAGLGHSMALKADGTVAVWGWNFNGITNVPAGLRNAIAIAAGFTHSLALNADGTVIAWGENYAGATNVPANLTNVVAIAGGTFYSLALKSDGGVVAWGSQTTVPSGLTNVFSIAAGGYHSLAVVGDHPPVAHAPLSNLKWNSNGFNISLPTQSGRVYRLEYKSSLADANWTALPLVTGNGSTLTLTDFTATNSQRFYRVRRW